MKLNFGKQRKSIRLKSWDYSSPGGYFVTICAYNREHLFGEIRQGKMPVNEHVNILRQCWDDLSLHYPNVQLDEFIVMPNHVHGVIILKDIDNMAVGDGLKPSLNSNRTGYKPVPTRQRHGLTEIIRAFKTFSARRINILQDTQGRPVWQRSFHDHIIRNDEELDKIRQYIINNPIGWDMDEYDLELGCRDRSSIRQAANREFICQYILSFVGLSRRATHAPILAPRIHWYGIIRGYVATGLANNKANYNVVSLLKNKIIPVPT